MISPTLENFKRKTSAGNLIPIYKKISLDFENPSLILKIYQMKRMFIFLKVMKDL